jgi:hypothetical protein
LKPRPFKAPDQKHLIKSTRSKGTPSKALDQKDLTGGLPSFQGIGLIEGFSNP